VPVGGQAAEPSADRGSIFGTINKAAGTRVVLYGPGGIGKTTLAMHSPGPVAFFDLDESLPKLETNGLEILPVEVSDWSGIRMALAGDHWSGIRTIVIDTGTKAEELAGLHVLKTVKHEKGHAIDRLEGYGFGKGYQHVYEEFTKLLSDLDRHMRAGRNVILICHDCVAKVTNPRGEDYDRFEPRLQNPPSGKSSVRLRVKEWADHVIFLGYEVSVDNTTGKVQRGSGSKVLYHTESPYQMAKGRGISGERDFDLKTGWQGVLKN
jgi:hypothetical protein